MTTITLTDMSTGKTIEVAIAEPVSNPTWLNVAGLLGAAAIVATLAFVAIVF